ncbi:MAG: serine--tRNA ligase, partial [Myxococcota bacterium]
MIDLRLLRRAPAEVRAALARRGDPAVLELLDAVRALDERRRALATELDHLKAQRNEAARADAQVVKQHGALAPEIVAERRVLGERIADAEAAVHEVETALEAKALYLPNAPLADVPDGAASANRVVRAWGSPRPQTPDMRPHWELGERLGILDLPRGAKLAGSGFPVLVGSGARLARALIQFMLDLHMREHGYIEIEPPFVVRREILQGTGQLPKFEDDVYGTTDDLFLVPTAEVPITNLYKDEILDGGRLPIAHSAYTPCFRREAGAAGKDTRGLLRVHQFDKVELVRFVTPAESASELERITQHAEAVLQRLELPYRVVLLAAGDTGFAAAKTYDLEVWAPGVGAWLEVSSASS